MIRVATYKASIQADGSIYNESVEMSSEIDSMPLSPDQLAVAMDRVTEMRAAILARRKSWEGTAPEAPKEQPKPAGQMNLEGGKAPANAGPIVKCIKCGTPVEPRTSLQTGTPYSYCPKCKDNRRKDGTEFPPKKEA